MLKALQFLRGGDRWVLKSPQHLEQFGPLYEVFPDATFVVTHREPVAVVTSMATMATYTARMYHDPVDPALFGNYWADRLETMLGASVRDHDRLPAKPSKSVINEYLQSKERIEKTIEVDNIVRRRMQDFGDFLQPYIFR